MNINVLSKEVGLYFLLYLYGDRFLSQGFICGDDLVVLRGLCAEFSTTIEEVQRLYNKTR